MNVLDRFWAMVDDSGECWLWTGVRHKAGYGKFTCYYQTPTLLAHRFSYEIHHQRLIPEGMQLDHLCRNPSCVRPSHLEPVTARTNLLRSPITCASINAAKTHCPQDHPHNKENTYVTPQRTRHCRTCKREAKARKDKAKRDA